MIDYEFNNSLEQIAAAMAHEIKNPLTLIKSSLQLLELSDTDISHKKNYNVMYRELMRIDNLISDFINFSKPLQLNLSCFEISELINEVIEVFNAAFDEKKIDIIYNKLEKPLCVTLDFNRLKQVLINIVKNAIEASFENGKITIAEIKNNDYFGISIMDKGSGIPNNLIGKIGVPFFTTKETGTGLGIAISKQIVEGHKGSFNISTIENHGTCVTILFKTEI